MKKVIVLLVAVFMMCSFVSTAFAQDVQLPGTGKGDENANIAVGIDPYWLISGLLLGGFGIGASFEYQFLPFLSAEASVGYVGASYELWSYKIAYSQFSFLVGAKWYLMHTIAQTETAVNGPFAGMMIGGDILSYTYGDDSNSTFFFDIMPVVGYKWNFMGGKGFFVEPSVGYKIAIGNLEGYDVSTGGFYYNLKLGWSF
jgi:hypothetical protein